MDFAETIIEIKRLSIILRDKNTSDREKIYYTDKLHRHIDNLEVPQLIGEGNDNISGKILHN